MLEDNNVFQPFTNHLAAGEWRVLAWLENENFSYDIVSPMELHNSQSLLKDYKAVIFNTHCEYWTRQMFEAVKYFHENQGGWIINLSGNSMFREIDILEDESTRYLGIFQETCCDETQILGVRFSEDDYATCAPYKILTNHHWAFNGISVVENAIFGCKSLNQNTPRKHNKYDSGRPGLGKELSGEGASGWETDKLSITAPHDIKVIAKGLNNCGGADMVIREPEGSRGGMFSASALVFGGCLLIDQIASTIVKNIIKKSLNNIEE